MKANYHTHTSFCDGKNTPEEMVAAAIQKGFDTLGFTAHAMYPFDGEGYLSTARYDEYAQTIRALAETYRDRIKILLGFEADYIPGRTAPDRARYAPFKPDYLIGSIHFVCAGSPDKLVAVDYSPERLAEGIRDCFGGDAKAFLQSYFAALREMVSHHEFDIVGHPDLPRKFNGKLRYFDEAAPWYRDELVRTADALAASGKTVEINTGAISRGWLDDAYPSKEFRRLLAERGVRMIVNSDAHFVDGLDCGFDRRWVD